MAISKSNIKSRRKPHVIALTEIYKLHRMSHHSADLSTRCFFFSCKDCTFCDIWKLGQFGHHVSNFQLWRKTITWSNRIVYGLLKYWFDLSTWIILSWVEFHIRKCNSFYYRECFSAFEKLIRLS
jgi:hypothetical protein